MNYELLIILLSILFSAFFSGMEIAFVAANKLHIELEKKKEGLLPRVLGIITEKSSKFITTMLVGNNISLVIYSYFMGKLLMGWFQLLLPSDFMIVNYLLSDLELLTQTVISTLLILITAEFVPKALFRIYANETLKLFAFPAYLFFNYISEQLETGNEDEDVDSEIQIFQNALEFHKVKAREIMVPRTEIIAIDIHTNVNVLKNTFIETGFSKILVYKNSLDDIIGYVHAFELFKQPKTIKSILLPVEIVPESMVIGDVLNVLIKKRKSIAVVVDEYGGTSGIITVEDVVEELFGEIEDEHDNQELLEEKIAENEYNFSARLEVDYLNEEYNLDIPKEDAYETLGGFIINQTENIPEEKEVVNIEGFYIQIIKASSTKIDHIYLKVLPDQE